MRRANTNNISANVLDRIGPDARGAGIFRLLRRVNCPRQEQIAEIMFLVADFTLNFARLLVEASKPADFVRKKRHAKGVTRAEAGAIEETVLALEKKLRNSAATYPDDARAIVITAAYIRRILSNSRVASYLIAVHPEIITELKAVDAARSGPINFRRRLKGTGTIGAPSSS